MAMFEKHQLLQMMCTSQYAGAGHNTVSVTYLNHKNDLHTLSSIQCNLMSVVKLIKMH